MKRLGRWVFNGLAVVSLLLCIGDGLTWPDNDFAIYWTWHGKLICVDSFEDLPNSNAITVREFNPWPAKVPLHAIICSVEAGTEVPYPLGMGKPLEVWVDRNNQPVEHYDSGGHWYGQAAVSARFQVPWVFGIIFLLAILPVAWVVLKYRSYQRLDHRRRNSLCLTCGYDLRATPERCPECGALREKGRWGESRKWMKK